MTSKKFNSSNIQRASILFATMVFAVAANAESVKTEHKGNLNVKNETAVQGVTLPPGDYEVRELKTAQGSTVEFIRHYWNEAASELVQAEEDQLIARVPVTEQATNERPAHTKLQLSADSRTATALQIRHVPVDYVFEATQSASRQDAATNSASGTQ